MQDGKKTYNKKYVFRSTKRITKYTPNTFKEISKKKVKPVQRDRRQVE